MLVKHAVAQLELLASLPFLRPSYFCVRLVYIWSSVSFLSFFCVYIYYIYAIYS